MRMKAKTKGAVNEKSVRLTITRILFLFLAFSVFFLVGACTRATRIERGGVKVLFDASSPITKLETLPQIIAQSISPLIPVSPAVALTTTRLAFAKPITITLPVDPAKLPAGADAKRLHAVLLMDGLREELSAPVVLSEDRLHASFSTDRLLPLVNDNAPASTRPGEAPPSGPPGIVIGADSEPIVILDRSSGIEISCPTSAQAVAAPFVQPAKTLVTAALAKYRGMGFTVPALARIHLERFPDDRKNSLADAGGGERIRVNLTRWLGTPDAGRESALAHECFHLVQQTMQLSNLRTGGYALDNETLSPLSTRWFAEGTANFMLTRCYPDWLHVGSELASISLHYGYRSLTAYDDTQTTNLDVRLPHQYENYIFFAYLNSLYDGTAIIRECCSLFASSRFVLDTSEEDKNAEQAAWNMMDVLNQVLRTTSDRLGRKRNLSVVYADFLVHFYWLKDFEPMSYLSATSPDDYVQRIIKELGEPRQIRLPLGAATASSQDRTVDSALVTGWNIPDGTVLSKSVTTNGGNYCITHAYRIDSMSSDKSKPTLKGDLTITLDTTRTDLKDRVMMIVFPIKNGVQEPEVGNPANPIQIKNWQTYAGALVWIMDFTRPGGLEMTLKATLKPAAQYFVEAFEDGNSEGGIRPIANGAKVSLPGTPYLNWGLRLPKGEAAKPRTGKYLRFSMLRVTIDDGAPHYMRDRGLYAVPFGTYRMKCEAMDEDNNPAATISFTVINTYPDVPDETAKLQKAIETAKTQDYRVWGGTSTSNRKDIFDRQLNLVEHLQKRFLHKEAWTLIESLGKEYADVLQDASYGRWYNKTRHDVAYALGKTAECVDSLEKLTTFEPADRSRILYQIVCEYMSLENNLAKSDEYYKKHLDSLPPDKRPADPSNPWGPR